MNKSTGTLIRGRSRSALSHHPLTRLVEDYQPRETTIKSPPSRNRPERGPEIPSFSYSSSSTSSSCTLFQGERGPSWSLRSLEIGGRNVIKPNGGGHEKARGSPRLAPPTRVAASRRVHPLPPPSPSLKAAL